MSWSVSKTLRNESDVFPAQKIIDELNAIDRTNIGNSQCVEERDEQIEAVLRAVLQLLIEGGFSNAEEISVSMSGHANPGHKATSGWANDMINITVAVKQYRAN